MFVALVVLLMLSYFRDHSYFCSRKYPYFKHIVSTV